MRPFYIFLCERNAVGGFSTEDTLACFLPLVRQVVEAHAAGQVAPLAGLKDLNVEGVRIWFEQAKLAPPQVSPRLAEVTGTARSAVEVVEETAHTSDTRSGEKNVANLLIGERGAPLTKPVYLPGYVSWEHEIDQHDPLTDIFSLGLILASLACRLDLHEPADLARFVQQRRNPFSLAPELHPVLAQAIVRMTELDRQRRPPELVRVLRSLENYRDQAVDLDIELARVDGFSSRDLHGKQQVVLSRLQERLFEISRRNRLLHFRPTLQTVNLTHASVPLSFDVKNIRPDQILTWNKPFQTDLVANGPLTLNKYLNFSEALYLPGVLDKIKAEATRDEKEYGFAQLRLVACFLHWTDLKVTPPERYDSPLVLVPVILSKKKGIRDAFQLELQHTEAEINPVVRHQFKQLYGIDLPELLDLEKTDLDAFYELLSAAIRRSEAAVTLTKVDRPRIDLIHQKARRRLDQYQRAARVGGRGVRSFLDLDYSYDPANYHPLGARLFSARIRPAVSRLRTVIEERPRPRQFMAAPVKPAEQAAGKATAGTPAVAAAPAAVEQTRQMYALREGGDENPYAWDFDLCSVTLGNFKYRKMSLVRDYTSLVSDQPACPGFESIFSLTPRPLESVTAEPPLEERYHVVPCDPTQSAAVAKAKTGGSYIIQGPPGTGKSQTITNLIADYIIRGKRVLFVCEKRAAIDVVFLRLKQQGLAELCCLIHDSQADKKGFVMDLKETYETFLADGDGQKEASKQRRSAVQLITQELQPLEAFDAAMRAESPAAGISLRQLVDAALPPLTNTPATSAANSASSGSSNLLTPLVRERLPTYAQWKGARPQLDRLREMLLEFQPEGILAKHPLRLLAMHVAQAERPLALITAGLQAARAALRDLTRALEQSGLQREQWNPAGAARTLIEYAGQMESLIRSRQVELLDRRSPLSQRLAEFTAEEKQARGVLDLATSRTVFWRRKLAPEELEVAIAHASKLEGSWLAFVQPAWWRLRSVMRECYDFSKHIVRPPWSKVLSNLANEYEAQRLYDQINQRAKQEFGFEGALAPFAAAIETLRTAVEHLPPAAAAVHQRLLAKPAEGLAQLEPLLNAGQAQARLDAAAADFLTGVEHCALDELEASLTRLDAASNDLPRLLPALELLGQLPPPVAGAVRELPLELSELERAVAAATLDKLLAAEPALSRFNSKVRDRAVKRLEQQVDGWQQSNAELVRQQVRAKFLEHVQVSSATGPAAKGGDLEFKKAYARGRKELEHEFGKTMRYRSIRDLVGGDTALVVHDLKPVWLMSPLSVSDTLPLDCTQFDVVIFDEASQVTLEEAIPCIFRAPQAIVVGDEMQLPPTSFFATKREEEEEALQLDDAGETVEYSLDSNSLLNHASRNLSSTMLGWHYRSRSESLISFSNWAFYGGRLLTVPEEQVSTVALPEIRAADSAAGKEHVADLLARPLSFHFLPEGIYEKRRNRSEADYIAELVRGLLQDEKRFSIGIIAFSEAQQGEIENALERLAEQDETFRQQLEAEYEREEDGQFVGLLVKNLENIQGDERDVVILSVCYGYDRQRRMLMNFGPINVSGGEKRLNVAFSRSKQHMALVSSIQSTDIKNEHNDGANCLKSYLRYAAASSNGNGTEAELVLQELARWRGRAAAEQPIEQNAVVESIAAELTALGFIVERNVGQSHFRCDLAVRHGAETVYRLGILVDTPRSYQQRDLLERELMKPRLLRNFGWNIAHVLSTEWYSNRSETLSGLKELLQ